MWAETGEPMITILAGKNCNLAENYTKTTAKATKVSKAKFLPEKVIVYTEYWRDCPRWQDVFHISPSTSTHGHKQEQLCFLSNYVMIPQKDGVQVCCFMCGSCSFQTSHLQAVKRGQQSLPQTWSESNTWIRFLSVGLVPSLSGERESSLTAN